LQPSTTNPWCCPRCRGSLDAAISRLTCLGCGSTYPIIAGIPDFRLDIPAWVAVEEDRAKAERLAATLAGRPASELVAHVFGARAGWTAADVSRRTREVTEGPARLGLDLDTWLEAATSREPFLDLGCGAGQLLAAAAGRGRHGIGVDVMLEWLVVARALIAEHGGTAVLAAAMAEALPLPSGSVRGVVSLDVIEHVGDQGGFLREIDRVLAPEGIAALATPNRFSLGAETHVGIWGVGWLPRRWQARYVRWRSGKAYDYCQLLGVLELRRLFARETSLRPHVLVPEIPRAHLRQFGRGKARLGVCYNALAGLTLARPVLQFIGPYFRVVASKVPAGVRQAVPISRL
jgi:2-polyprenyl-3-methyl-5-hydroxy-6-metoxy-1,4-benzoquinol methylase